MGVIWASLQRLGVVEASSLADEEPLPIAAKSTSGIPLMAILGSALTVVLPTIGLRSVRKILGNIIRKRDPCVRVTSLFSVARTNAFVTDPVTHTPTQQNVKRRIVSDQDSNLNSTEDQILALSRHTIMVSLQ